MIVPLFKGKGEVTEYIYAEFLIDKVRRVTGSLIDDKQRRFRAGRVCVDQIRSLPLSR